MWALPLSSLDLGCPLKSHPEESLSREKSQIYPVRAGVYRSTRASWPGPESQFSCVISGKLLALSVFNVPVSKRELIVSAFEAAVGIAE